MSMSARRDGWQPRLGAVVDGQSVRFRVWAPTAKSVELALEGGPAQPMAAEAEGYFALRLDGVDAGSRYRYRVDGQGPYPDPASRAQPLGVHGPSEVTDPSRFRWTDQAWTGIELSDVVLYELHVGAFTPAGTFRGVRERLPLVRDLGVTAIELLPLGDFPGRRNWGYDGVCLFAPARCYGAPDDLRALVDEAHRLGLAMFLDVVYNHLGPDGNYLGVYSPHYFTDRHRTPWGLGANLDGPHSEHARAFLIENALHWLVEYHFDGLRLDATHAMRDDSPHPFLAELAQRAHALPGPRRLVIAEDERNLAALVRSPAEGGRGLDGVWADDFHHQMRCCLAGDRDGYFADFSGKPSDIADTVTHGFFYRGQTVERLGRPRGSDTTGIPLRRFVFCVQNHDQVGNRALGERLHHQIDAAAYRAALALLLMAPETPLLFMGQEWAAKSSFLYFTDHEPDLGRKVTEGRREEFRAFAAFSSPELRLRIPDPQAESTFARSRLDWSEREREPFASVWRLHQTLLATRRALLPRVERTPVVEAHGGTVAMAYPDCLVVAQTARAGKVELDAYGPGTDWQLALDTEAPAFAPDAQPPAVTRTPTSLTIAFRRAGALVFGRQSQRTQA
ncbi:MAG: malto-oligosyltrehalose trehalohydrolase [Deltaproteobacteria bacterium]|nr:malto-oligosyltrehalose trehalohydrolase [Deltaproteobacteria bacterium]